MSAEKRIWVLDGAMGTTLEGLGHNVSTPLWGCDLLHQDPDTIRNVHERFLASGADVIETATYQCTLPSLCRQTNLDEDAGSAVMRSAVSIAAQAASSSSRQASIALSIGPFGATLSPGQEYAGIYPPPYGPSTSSNAFNNPGDEERAVQALTDFHLERLLTFSADPEVWANVGWIAFETIPVLHEIRAIRRAMGRLAEARDTKKKFWITSAFPEGRHPQTSGEGKVAVAEVVATMIGDPTDQYPPSDGVGLNCTNPSYISALSSEFTEAMRLAKGEKPVFVLYPDGGSVYDVVTRTWSSGGVDPAEWAQGIVHVAREVEAAMENGEKVWSGVIVGGCCKAGFEEIKALRVALDQQS